MARAAAQSDYWVSTAGNDATGDGLSLATAWATLQHAADWLCGNVDFYGGTSNVNLANGAYGGLICRGQWVGGDNQSPYGPVLFKAVNVGGAVITSSMGASFKGQFGVAGLKLPSVYASAGGQVWLDANLEWIASPTQPHIWAAEDGIIVGSKPYTISGSAGQHEFASNNGTIEILGSTFGNVVTITGAPAFWTFAFAYGGSIADKNRVFSGAVSTPAGAPGVQCYSTQLNGLIDTNSGGNPNYFPGNIAGSGLYV